ncbi:hypothetical protein ACQUJZ_21975 [Ralstonia pseudosolanacearum]|uniref:hypothetical protein n=1 Tax=Ralstonia pseudosolanacearum TaxID=1310165 RepID=UPI0013E39E11|nr:hypothetical protein [Ralstonia pseudosolanacearum]MCK4139304.1 hypothetical protein [Ralstonia pseudosolanacearum]UQY84351.1 hypothetical protein JNO62_16355 [Ralstonia pseudosolanacearum]
MTRVLRLGANGPLARNTTRVFLAHPAVVLTRCLRRTGRLENPEAGQRSSMASGSRRRCRAGTSARPGPKA